MIEMFRNLDVLTNLVLILFLMIAIDDKLISDELFTEFFLCDLAQCKGACCVEGESGAPLEEEEIQYLEDVFPEAEKYMRPEGIQAIEEAGFFEIDTDGDYVTTLVQGKECAYVHFDDNGTAKCALETAYLNNETHWQKPISCHLYPIRLTELKDFTALNYHRWPICKPACECGSKISLPVFKFARTSLTRKFGEDFYSKLEAAFSLWKSKK